MRRYIILLAVVLTVPDAPLSSLAQSDPDDGSWNDGAPDAPDSVPVDGGISLLVAGGIAFGVKRAKNVRKKNIE